MCTSFLAHDPATFCVTGRAYDYHEQMRFITATTLPGTIFHSVLDNAVSWTSQFCIVTIETEEIPYNVPFEGMNSGGLCIAGHEATADYPGNNPGPTISSDDVVNYVLAQAGTVAQAKQLLQNINIPANSWQMHYILFDASGNSLVVEFKDGSIVFYENKSYVLTNDPDMNQQLENQANYGKLTNWPEDGMVSLPGDWTSTSRYTRATIMLKFSLPYAHTNDDAILMSKGIIESVSRVKGVDLRDKSDKSPIFTQMQIIKDITNGRIFLRQYDDVWTPVIVPWGKMG